MIIYKIYTTISVLYDFKLTTKVHTEEKYSYNFLWARRYELGNFSQNIQKLAVYDENNNSLILKKLQKICGKLIVLELKKLSLDIIFINQLDKDCYFMKINFI